MRVAVIGGGASGFFSAIWVKTNHPHAQVTIFEKNSKLLAKVKISGGGRCNVTNSITSPGELAKQYPRGKNHLKKLFPVFGSKEMIEWLKSKGVELYTQEDGCIFPTSDNSQTIIDCFLTESSRLGVDVQTNKTLIECKRETDRFVLTFRDGEVKEFDKVIVATGGQPKRVGLQWIEALGHEIVDPVPSLFTFNMPDEAITSLMGIVVNPASVRVQGTKLQAEGPLLITHWGMSGPAILKLSAWGARILAEKDYRFRINVNWLHHLTEDAVRTRINESIEGHGRRILKNENLFRLPNRLWLYLLEKTDVAGTKGWMELSKKDKNRLINALIHDEYEVRGKTTFKEEFVTAGGVSLNSIDMRTMQSKVCPGMYFTGEVMDIDGITGGFNFQAAWTTAYVAARLN